MPFEPMSLPYWTVPSWNPNVNEARAAGEYPTAGWANQLQALHDETITKVNEAGALADSVAGSVGVIGETHVPGTLLIAGEGGSFKALAPGTLHQVLQPNSNIADGIEWRTMLPTGSAVAGSLLVFDGTNWTTVPVGANAPGAVNGGFLRYDARSPLKVAWSADDTATSIVENSPLTKIDPPAHYWDFPVTQWSVARTLGTSVQFEPVQWLVTTARNAGLYTAIPNGAEILITTIPPIFRPPADRLSNPSTIYNAATGASAGSFNVCTYTNGNITLKVPATGGPFSLISSTSATTFDIFPGNFNRA